MAETYLPQNINIDNGISPSLFHNISYLHALKILTCDLCSIYSTEDGIVHIDLCQSCSRKHD